MSLSRFLAVLRASSRFAFPTMVWNVSGLARAVSTSDWKNAQVACLICASICGGTPAA
jgi:hypothetical protein